MAHFIKVHPINYTYEMAINLDLVCEAKPLINDEPGCHIYFVHGGATGHLAVRESIDDIIKMGNKQHQLIVPVDKSIQQGAFEGSYLIS